jgi:hypothetical protein
MKTTFLILLLSVLGSSATYAQRNADRLIDVVKSDDASVTVKVPGWLIERALKIAVKIDQADSVDDVSDVKTLVATTDEDPLHQDDDMEAWKRISESIKQVRVSFVGEARNPQTAQRASELITKLKTQDNFATYAKVRAEGDQIEVMVREDDQAVKNILLYIHGGGTMGVIHVKGNIKVSDFEQAQFSWQKDNKDEDDQ